MSTIDGAVVAEESLATSPHAHPQEQQPLPPGPSNGRRINRFLKRSKPSSPVDAARPSSSSSPAVAEKPRLKGILADSSRAGAPQPHVRTVSHNVDPPLPSSSTTKASRSAVHLATAPGLHEADDSTPTTSPSKLKKKRSFPKALSDDKASRWLTPNLMKGSLSTSALALFPNSSSHLDPLPPPPKAADDAEVRKRKSGRHSLAALFQSKQRVASAPVVLAVPSPVEDPIDDKQIVMPISLDSPVKTQTLPKALSSPPKLSQPSFESHRVTNLETSSSPNLRISARQPPSLNHPPRQPPSGIPVLVRPSSHSQLRSRPRAPSYTNGTPRGAIVYTGPPSTSSLSHMSPLGSSINLSRTSLSLSQTSLLLPSEPRDQLLSKDHYHLRFATTYINMLITPALRNATFSKSDRNMEIKHITEDRLGMLARVERTWGGSWAEAASDLMSGNTSGVTPEVREAKLRACNITATAKSRERKVFVSALRDGILFCFLFNRLFPSQPAHIQRVKVPKDDVRIAANFDRFFAACREMGVPESELFTLANLDEHSPHGLAKVSKTILVLAQMAVPVSSPTTSMIPVPKPRASASRLSPPADSGDVTVVATPTATASSSPSQGTSPRSPGSTRVYGPSSSRSVRERRLRSSSSDLLARLQSEAGSSTGGAANGAGVVAAAAGAAAGAVSKTGAAGSARGGSSHGVSQSPSSSPTVATPPTPPTKSPVRGTTPLTPLSRSAPSTQGTPPTARPPLRTSTILPPSSSSTITTTSAASASTASVKSSHISFARPSDASVTSNSGYHRVSVNDWNSSASSIHSVHHLAPLHERERTPSLVSTNSHVASSYSRSSISNGSAPTIVGDDPTRTLEVEDDYDQMRAATNGLVDAPSQGGLGGSLPNRPPSPRRMSEQTLQEARRKIIGTLLSSTEDLSLQNRGSQDDARGIALSQSLAALEGSPSLGASKLLSDSPRIRPISRGARQSLELQQQQQRLSEEEPTAAVSSQLPPRPRIRRPSTTGRIVVPKRPQSPISPQLSLSMHGALISPTITIESVSGSADQFGRMSKEERRRSEDYARNPIQSANGRLMNMKNHSMINLPSTHSRRTSTLSGHSRDSMVHASLQVLEFSEPGQDPVRFQLGNCIGRGQFGSVYRSLNLTTGQMVAIKRIRLSGMKEKEVRDVMREVELLKRLSHPGIVKYEGMSRDDQYLNIVLEFVENGSLGQTLKAFGKFNERLVSSYVGKILEGLHYLHSQGVVHCDLKAANILSTKNGNIKLSDFGVSLNMRAVENFAERASVGKAEGAKGVSEIAGTPNWMAPEIIKLSGASPASDIWSLGCTVIELLTGKPPYSGVGNSMTVLFRIVEDAMPPLPVGASADALDFLKLCFAKDPKQRPTAAMLFQHEWVRSSLPDMAKLHFDSLPFVHRMAQKSDHGVPRVDSQRIFDSSQARSASASMVDLPGAATTRELEGVAETSRRAQASMVSLHSHYSQSTTALDSSVAKAHSLVKTRFAKSITCHVCLDGVKKAAYLCQNCGLITHSKCAKGANPRCNVREQLALLVSQQDWTPSAPSSRDNSPYPWDSQGGSTPLTSLPARLFARAGGSKSSLLAASTTSLVDHPAGDKESASGASSGARRPSRLSSGAASATRPYPFPADHPVPEKAVSGSLRSRHSQTSEEDGTSANTRDRSTSLIRIDEDVPAQSSHLGGGGPRTYPPPIQHVPTVRVLEPGPEDRGISGGPAVRRKQRRERDSKSECIIA
ncbi:Protein kinase of the Mitotic Exit Network [Vanrija albida]|uniref:Protein kinase of the Mitotic Exit Network n=1 Tax=Vanrija albida TaxID=181172 RepID=A0ABR3PUT6_9TREE